MKSILIVEDQKVQAEALKKLIAEQVADVDIYIATGSKDAYDIYHKKHIDLFILDVELSMGEGEQNGIEVGIELRNSEMYRKTPIIYVTSYMEKIHRAVNDVHCFNYLLKPYKREDVFRALDEADKFSEQLGCEISIVDNRGGIFKINFDDIMIIKSKGHIVTIYTKLRSFSTREKTLKEYEAMLPNEFVQIHKSYVINTRYVRNYEKTTRSVSINNEQCLTVGRAYKENFEKVFMTGR